MTYRIIETGSTGNAIIYHNEVLVDVGVSYKKIRPYIQDIELILLTHIHSDHFNHSTISKISKDWPNIKFISGIFLEEELSNLGVKNKETLQSEEVYFYLGYEVSPIQLIHFNSNMTKCLNYGWRIHKNDYKIIHMTDTTSYKNIRARDYDLYALEANYDEDTIDDIIQEQHLKGQFAHGVRSKYSHASLQQAYEFYNSNKKTNSELILLHQSNKYL